MKYILIAILGFTLLFSSSSDTVQKYLSSADRAGTHLENLVFDGEFDKAEAFAKLANEKYSDNADILCWTGKLYTEKLDLDLAKVYYIRALDINPTHEMAKIQLELIEEQEAAHENKAVEKLLELLRNQGLDFLLIFLGFLGAEIISKRYATCQHSSVYIRANHFIEKRALVQSFWSRFFSSFRYLLPRKFSIICPLINLLILVIMSLALLIPFLFVEFYYEITLFTSEPFITMSSVYIEAHFWSVFAWIITLTFISMNLLSSLSLTTKEVHYDIELVEELDHLVSDGEYSDVHEALDYLLSKGVAESEIRELLYKYSGDADAVLKYMCKKSTK